MMKGKAKGQAELLRTTADLLEKESMVYFSAENFRAVADLLEELVQQLEAAQPKWISVEERLPEKGQKVLVCGVKKGMQVGAFRGIPAPSRSRLWWWKKNTLLEVTHWMPMPEAPKEDV